MKKSKLYICFIVPLLMSSTNTTHFNEVEHTLLSTGQKTKTYKVIKSGTSKGICKSNVLGNEAASVTVSYDFLEKHKDYAPYNGYKKSYHLIYRLDVYVSSNVSYKGGVGNWFDGNNPAYLNSITVNTEYTSSSFSKLRYVTTPVENHSIYADTYVLLRDINPTRYVYETNAFNYVDCGVNIGFDANSGYESKSYSTHRKDSITDRDFNNMNSKLIAHMLVENKVAATKLTNKVALFYGNKLLRDKNDNRYIDSARDDLYSGPEKDSIPFMFSIFVTENIQNESDLKSATFSVTMKSTHGSSVWLDKFQSDANVTVYLI